MADTNAAAQTTQPRIPKVTRRDSVKIRLYWQARQNGAHPAQAARLAGVHEQTAYRWENQQKSGERDFTQAMGRALQKDQARRVLSEIALDPSVSGSYRVAAVAQLSKLEGWDSPPVARLEVKHLLPGVQAWLEGATDPGVIDVEAAEPDGSSSPKSLPPKDNPDRESDKIDYVNSKSDGT